MRCQRHHRLIDPDIAEALTTYPKPLAIIEARLWTA